jgi:hypothetical protein
MRPHLAPAAPWAAWVEREDQSPGVTLAIEAVRAGARDEDLVLRLLEAVELQSPSPHLPRLPLPPDPRSDVRESLASGLPGTPTRAMEALGRLGAAARRAVPTVEARFAAPSAASERLFAAGALLRLGSSRKDVVQTLRAAAVPPSAERRRDWAESLARVGAMEALADVGGADAALAGVAGLEWALADPSAIEERDLGYVRHAVRGAGRAVDETRVLAAERLAELLAGPFVGDGGDGSARFVLEVGDLSDSGYALRAFALDALGSLDDAARPHAAAVRALLSSPDVRIRAHAARALRRIGA